MPMRLAQLIDCAKPSNADQVNELAAILADHAETAAKPIADLIASAEHPIGTAVKSAEAKAEHTLSSICAAVTHWTGKEIQNLEELLKIHPNREPTPEEPVTPAAETPQPTTGSGDSSQPSTTTTSPTGDSGSTDAAQPQGAQ